jgi:CRP-like cAMP-binding protein
LFADTYHCDAIARTDAQVANVSRAAFFAALQRMPNTALSLMESHAKEVQILRARIEILRLRRVSEKLDAWLELYGKPPKGEWVRVADEIGVSQPALYRELAKRKTNSTP